MAGHPGIRDDRRDDAASQETPTGISSDDNPADVGSRPDEPAPLRRNRDFLLLWTGQAVSGLGASMAGIVYPLLTLAATRSVALAGLIGFVGMAVGTLMRLPSGVLADRWPRKPVMVVSDLARLLVTATIAVAVVMDRVTVHHLLAAAVISAACDVMFDSAQAVAVRDVVPSTQLPQALAHNEARGHLAGLAGQPLGGYLYGLGMSVPVLAHAASYLFSGVLIALIRRPLHDRGAERVHLPIWRDIPTGLRFVWRNAFLRLNLLCAAGFQLVFSGLGLVVIASATQRGSASVDVGIAFAMGGVGGILGAWATKRLQAWLRPANLVVAFGCTATLSLAALGTTHQIYVTGALIAAAYFMAAPANAMLVAAMIQITPAELHGRVLSAVVLVAGAAAPVGPLFGGLLLEHGGQAATFGIFSMITAALTLRMRLSPAMRAALRTGLQ
jgi:MFS family permease